MADALAIRSATLADEAAVTALWNVCGLMMPYNDAGHDFRFALGKVNSDVLVGVDAAGQIVGTIMVGHDGHRGWIWYVAADPAQQRQGIGRRMVEAGEQWLQKCGVEGLLLLIRETNTQVAAFYTRLGYEVIPRTVMKKSLKASHDGAG